MKKTYIIPTLQLIELNGETMIAESIQVNGNVTVTKQYVKEDVTNTSSKGYDVWDEDWNANK